jgi:hypothetical protein
MPVESVIVICHGTSSKLRFPEKVVVSWIPSPFGLKKGFETTPLPKVRARVSSMIERPCATVATWPPPDVAARSKV